MKIISSELEKIAGIISQYPQINLEEIAFVGRSNVGKSSFINAFLNRKNLARTSSKPGKTRTVNFYNVNNDFRLVDLPGYGYAKVSKSEKEKWKEIIETYLSNRENLLEVILIVDIRHAPSKEDVIMYNWLLEYGFTGYVIATKMDKISKGRLNKHIKIIKETLKIKDSNLILPFSSESKSNLEKIHQRIENILSCE
ncbi:hypothetical protein HMPREF3188_00436 [Tissierellia bacterium KA00581]|nr:hypothetical protein HMPREF3188_00436 [Tissierellia bacterium KA00581]